MSFMMLQTLRPPTALSRHAGLMVALLLALVAAARPAGAQTQADLRRENQALRTQVGDLQRDLAAARAEIAALRAEIAALKVQLTAARSAQPPTPAGPKPPAPAPAPASDDPTASPAAVFAHAVASYAEATAGLAIGAKTDDSERIIYMRTLQRWVERLNRSLRKPIEWTVKIVEPAAPLGQGYGVLLQAVDPTTGNGLGRSFLAMLPRTVANRFDRLVERNGLDATYVVKGSLVPRMQVNEDRPDKGTFDNPPLIGPFAEYDLTLVARAVMLPSDVADEAGEAGGGGKDRGGDKGGAGGPGTAGPGGGSR